MDDCRNTRNFLCLRPFIMRSKKPVKSRKYSLNRTIKQKLNKIEHDECLKIILTVYYIVIKVDCKAIKSRCYDNWLEIKQPELDMVSIFDIITIP